MTNPQTVGLSDREDIRRAITKLVQDHRLFSPHAYTFDDIMALFPSEPVLAWTRETPTKYGGYLYRKSSTSSHIYLDFNGVWVREGKFVYPLSRYEGWWLGPISIPTRLTRLVEAIPEYSWTCPTCSVRNYVITIVGVKICSDCRTEVQLC